MMNNRKIQSRISIMLILAFMWTVLSCPFSIKADTDDNQYNFFINNVVRKAGFEPANKSGYKANIETYYAYNLLVYGDPEDVESNGVPSGYPSQKQDAKEEWRYLGYNYDGEPVTNEDFRDDREMQEGETYSDWIPHSVNVSGAGASWDNLEKMFPDDTEGIIKKQNWSEREWERNGVFKHYYFFIFS